MTAALGVSLLALSVILFQLGYIHHRRPAPSRWTSPELVSNLYTVMLVSAFAMGVGLLVNFGIDFKSQSFTILDAMWIAAAFAGASVVFLVQRGFWVRWKAKDVPVDSREPDRASYRRSAKRRSPDDGASRKPHRAA